MLRKQLTSAAATALRRGALGRPVHNREAGARGLDCYKYDYNDPTGDTTSSIDVVEYNLTYDCVKQRWTFGMRTASPFSDDSLAVYGFAADSDGNATNNCQGLDEQVFVGWTVLGLTAGIEHFQGSCSNVSVALGPDEDRDAGSSSIEVTFNASVLGTNPKQINWLQYATSDTSLNPPPSALDDLPNNGLQTATPTQSTAFTLRKPAPSVSGSYDRVVAGDFDGDKRGDLLFYGVGTKPDVVWYGTGAVTFVSKPVAINSAYADVVSGDYNHDGTTDVLLYAPQGQSYILYGHTDRTFVSNAVSLGSYSQVVAGDFNGDGYDDFLLYRAGSGADGIWLNGPTGHQSVPVTINGSFTRVVAGDFNGDHRADLAFYASGPAADYVWLAGTTPGKFTSSSLSVNGAYKFVRTGDFNGDHRADLLLANPGLGSDTLLLAHAGGSVFQAGPTTLIDEPFTDVATGQFNGDAFGDVFFFAAGAMPEQFWLGHA